MNYCGECRCNTEMFRLQLTFTFVFIECVLRSLWPSEITGLKDQRICIKIGFKLGKFRTVLNA